MESDACTPHCGVKSIVPSSGRDDALGKLGNMVNLMKDALGDYATARNLFELSFADNNRAEAITWMKQVQLEHTVIAVSVVT